eukprot:1189171-Prorocentrum_minimum.AAC.3
MMDQYLQREAGSVVHPVSLLCSRGRPIRRRKRGYILTTDQSDAGSAGTFSRRTNQTQEAWVHSTRRFGRVKTPEPEGLSTDYRPRIKVRSKGGTGFVECPKLRLEGTCCSTMLEAACSGDPKKLDILISPVVGRPNKGLTPVWSPCFRACAAVVWRGSPLEVGWDGVGEHEHEKKKQEALRAPPAVPFGEAAEGHRLELDPVPVLQMGFGLVNNVRMLHIVADLGPTDHGVQLDVHPLLPSATEQSAVSFCVTLKLKNNRKRKRKRNPKNNGGSHSSYTFLIVGAFRALAKHWGEG